MTDKQCPYLCGGVFFFLLMQAVKSRGTARNHREGKKDDHSSPNVMSDLIYTFTGSHDYGAAKDTSKYRECQIEGSVNVPFNDTAITAAFDSSVRNKYSDILERMSEFVSDHLNPEMYVWLVKALMEIINQDTDIADDDSFYCLASGQPITKSQLVQFCEIEIQPFLVGTLHYILTRRRGKNSCGIGTLEWLGTKENRKERRYTGSVGGTITRDIRVFFYVKNEVPEAQDEDKQPVTEWATDDLEQDVACDVAETKTILDVNDGDAIDAAAESDAATTPAEEQGKEKRVIHQTVVNQYGAKSVYAEHIENFHMD